MSAFNFARLITVIDVLVAGGFSITGLIAPALILPAGSTPTEASFVFAMYAAARAIPLAFLTVSAAVKHNVPALLWLGLLAGTIQFFDAAVGLYQHDAGKSLGPLVLGALQLYAVSILRKHVQDGAG